MPVRTRRPPSQRVTEIQNFWSSNSIFPGLLPERRELHVRPGSRNAGLVPRVAPVKGKGIEPAFRDVMLSMIVLYSGLCDYDVII